MRPIGDGWDHDTFEADGIWIARFPRREAVAPAFEGELRLLPVLARAVPFAVPRTVGLIDFGDGSVGDPAVDFVGLWLGIGARTTEAVAEAYGVDDPSFFERVGFYSWMGAVHAIFYGLDTGLEHEVASGRDGLRRRLPTG